MLGPNIGNVQSHSYSANKLLMQRRKLIEKRRSKLNKREILISLTGRGNDLVEALTPKALEYEDMIVDGLSEKDVETTRRMLRAMFEHTVSFKAAERLRTKRRYRKS